MAMALKVLKIRNKDMDVFGAPFETMHIMANIMLVSDFEPFVEEFEAVAPKEGQMGYTICSKMVENSGIFIVEKYALLYLEKFKF